MPEGPPCSAPICVESWQRESQAAELGVPFIPWPGLGTSRAGPVQLGRQSILSFAAKISVGSALPRSLGELPRSLRDGWMGCLSPGKTAGPFPRAKAQRQNNPTAPASPYTLNHFCSCGAQEHHVKGQTHGDGFKANFCHVLATEPGSSSAKWREDLPNRIAVRITGGSCSQGGVILPPTRKHLANSGDFLGCRNGWWGGATTL